MRHDSEAKVDGEIARPRSDYFQFGEDFLRLYYQFGVLEGSRLFPGFHCIIIIILVETIGKFLLMVVSAGTARTHEVMGKKVRWVEKPFILSSNMSLGSYLIIIN